MKVYNYQSKQSPVQAQNKGQNNNSGKFGWVKNKLRNLPWAKIGKWSFRLGALGILLVACLFIYYSRSLPDPNRLLGRNVPESTKIYAKDGTLLYEVHGEFKRTLVNLDQISPNLRNATLVAEDRNFYSHSGISITGILRSVFVDVIARKKVAGGSTITQQFVKNAILTNEKSYVRKIKEIILSIELEARFSKDDIFKLYLNEIPYGRNAYGSEAASETYFNKKASELTVAESAYLAALPQAPSKFNPSGPNFDLLQQRQQYILSGMKDLKYITDDQYNQALAEDVKFQTITNSIKAPHFVQYVQEYLADKYGEDTLQEGGLKVYTTLDPQLQEIAEKAVADGVKKNQAANGWNGALVAIDPKTGQILAMVGSKDYFGENYPAGCNPKTCLFSPNVNIATSLQQPGSSFKPYAYVTAFGKDFKYAPASMLLDVKTSFGDYSPNNFNLGQNGPVSMRKALAGSLNIPAVKTIALVGQDKVIETARSLGITSQFKDCGLSLVLGGCDVTLLDHTAAYAALANGGKREGKTSIMKVVSQEGQILEEYKESSEQVLDPQAVYELTNIMSDNSARAYVFGANSPLQLGNRPVAAKTGTTQDFRDGWTMGFTPSLAAGVWTGNNNNTPMKKDAVLMAGPIWNQFMKEALKNTPIEQFKVPDGIKTVTIDAVSGKLPTEYTADTRSDVFADYAVPTKYDDVHIPVKIDTLTGLPADDSTPSDRVTIEVYKVLHSEKPNTPSWENPVIAWALANGYKYPPGSGINNLPPADSSKINFVTPKDGATISTLPFTITIDPGTGDIDRIDISIDGTVIGSVTGSPYTLTVNQQYTDGSHSISAKVIYKDTSTGSKSIDVKMALNGALTITTPDSNSTITSPQTLTAESDKDFDTVTFWYVQGTKNTQIGVASKSQIAGTYQYSMDWNTVPKAGSYMIYAKSNTGITSDKVTITIP